jgi:hypothetical protein
MYSNTQEGSVVGLSEEILATLNFHAPHRRAVHVFDAQGYPNGSSLVLLIVGTLITCSREKRGVWKMGGWFSNKLFLFV